MARRVLQSLATATPKWNLRSGSSCSYDPLLAGEVSSRSSIRRGIAKSEIDCNLVRVNISATSKKSVLAGVYCRNDSWGIGAGVYPRLNGPWRSSTSPANSRSASAISCTCKCKTLCWCRILMRIPSYPATEQAHSAGISKPDRPFAVPGRGFFGFDEPSATPAINGF